MCIVKRPRGKVQSYGFHNTCNANVQWIPTKFNIGSWVTLNPRTFGVWTRDARLHGGPNLRGAYNGQINDQRFKVGMLVVHDVSRNPWVESILIRQAYAPWQTRLNPDLVVHRPKCNCKCCRFDAITLLILYWCQLHWGLVVAYCCQQAKLQLVSCKCVCIVF